jgi:hypothetical protein
VEGCLQQKGLLQEPVTNSLLVETDCSDASVWDIDE